MDEWKKDKNKKLTKQRKKTEPKIRANATMKELLAHPHLIWRQNFEGLYSHVLQLKTFIYVFNMFNISRLLLIEDHHSRHYHGDARICNYLSFPSNIHCVPYDVGKIPCQNTLSILFDDPETTSLCFQGRPYFTDLLVTIKYDIAILPPRIQFHSVYHDTFQQIKRSLQLSTTNYLVVHWRRGDQLTTRCTNTFTGLHDHSVNCANSSELVNVLARYGYVKYDTKKRKIIGQVVLVSNEDDVETLTYLQNQGLLVLLDRINDPLHSPDDLIHVTIDTLFMLDAQTVLNFGVSTMNDVLEAERMVLKKSFCITPQDNSSWCALWKQTHSDPRRLKKNKNPSTLSDYTPAMIEKAFRTPKESKKKENVTTKFIGNQTKPNFPKAQKDFQTKRRKRSNTKSSNSKKPKLKQNANSTVKISHLF
jgi:hypothetical protein